jgi:hypothetical protein
MDFNNFQPGLNAPLPRLDDDEDEDEEVEEALVAKRDPPYPSSSRSGS